MYLKCLVFSAVLSHVLCLGCCVEGIRAASGKNSFCGAELTFGFVRYECVSHVSKFVCLFDFNVCDSPLFVG